MRWMQCTLTGLELERLNLRRMQLSVSPRDCFARCGSLTALHVLVLKALRGYTAGGPDSG